MTNQQQIDKFLKQALEEDIGDGDHSSNCSIPSSQEGSVKLLAKESGILAGLEFGLKVFELIDPEIIAETFKVDGNEIEVGDTICILHGKTRALLKGERLFLNLLQRMSGIASKTHYFVKLIEGTKAQLLDTRKTTPNMRYFEKYAVKIGGGVNHRMGLYDMIMLKDNHIDFAGGIEAAVTKAVSYLEEEGLDLPIEIETRNLEEVKEVLSVGQVDRIMLDNFNIEDTKSAVRLVNGRFSLESSGGITEATIRSYAETGVNFISVGALTHSVKSLDLSLKASN